MTPPSLRPYSAGDAGGVEGEGVEVVGFDFGAEAGRAVVDEGDAVEDELGLVLGAAGVEDGVAFVEPAGLGVDEVLDGAAGEGGDALLDLRGADLLDGVGAVGVDERGGGGDLDGGVGAGEGEREGALGGERGADFEGLGGGPKAGGLGANLVEAVG